MRRLALLLALLVGCANIIDVEERKLVGDGGVGAAGSLDCADYCAEQRMLCTKENNSELFYSESGCMGACAAYAPGDPANPTGNTLACRMNQLAKARAIGEAATYCPGAGPGGSALGAADNSTACGSNCEGYCALYGAVCSDRPIADCLNKCKALPDQGKINATANFNDGEDTIQCRLAHVTAAAAAKFINNEEERQVHCAHSGLKSSEQCDVKDSTKILCPDFCKITMAACAGANKVYEDDAQCQKVCAELEPGKTTELLTNTTRCRRENAYAALTGTAVNSALACSNAGPAPAGCGKDGKCESYCALAAKACPAGFKAKWADDEACRSACRDLPDDGQEVVYSTEAALSAARGTLQCRVLRVARALGGNLAPETCAAALGEVGSACGP